MVVSINRGKYEPQYTILPYHGTRDKVRLKPTSKTRMLRNSILRCHELSELEPAVVFGVWGLGLGVKSLGFWVTVEGSMVDCSWELDCPAWVERVKCSDRSLLSPCLLVVSRE